jgi:hypothetical protein
MGDYVANEIGIPISKISIVAIRFGQNQEIVNAWKNISLWFRMKSVERMQVAIARDLVGLDNLTLLGTIFSSIYTHPLFTKINRVR